MKLTEVLVSAAVFIIASAVIASSLVNIRRSVSKSEASSRSAVLLLESDEFLRKQIQGFDISYWKDFDSEFEGVKERLLRSCDEKEMEIVSVSPVHDKKRGAEGIKIEWNFCGKKYSTQEFIKQRIADEEF